MIKNIKIKALICEFNPLHLGHRYILDEMKKNSAIICVMSGNFVQRGDFAILDKWRRTSMALECGADLVLELPIPFATANAETFAKGSVEILNSLEIVDELHFGSECGDTKVLEKIVESLYSDDYSEIFKKEISKGISFANAREKTVAKILGENYNGELKGSNNNLAIEYMKSLRHFQSEIKPVTIKRIGSAHDEICDAPIISAMQIRNMINENDFDFHEKLPIECLTELQKAIDEKDCPCQMSKLETAILCKLRTLDTETLSLLPDVSEGLENRLYKAIKTCNSVNEIIEFTKSKRYTHARIRRLILHAFLGVTAEKQKLEYIRILGMNETGKDIIKNCKKTLPIIGKADKNLNENAKKAFEFEGICDDIYQLSKPQIKACGSNYTNKLIIK